MSATPVLALINSRLGTDVVLVKLRRVGIDCRRISVIFPRRFVPNAVTCWLPVQSRPTFDVDCDPLLVAGPWRMRYGLSSQRAPIATLVERTGFDHGIAMDAVRHLQSGGTLLCVHAESEAEVSLAWHVLKHSMADLIAVGGDRERTDAMEEAPEPSYAVAIA
jgi:hypothetical protein